MEHPAPAVLWQNAQSDFLGQQQAILAARRLVHRVGGGYLHGYAVLPDKKTAGLQPSDLIIVAARPSMGKTTFAMNLCENAAMASDKPVLVFSLEMPAEQIMMRMIASLARVDQTKIRTGQNLDETEWSKIASVFGMFKQKNNLYIDDSSGLTPTELRSRARRVYRENGGLHSTCNR